MRNKNDPPILRLPLLLLFTCTLTGCALTRVSDGAHAQEMREVAYEQGYPDRGRSPLPGVHAYYDILTEAGCEVDIWRTTYYHVMDSHQSIIDWVSSTGLRPWLQDLSENEQHLYLTRYHELLQEQYPLQENGKILLAFPRLFIVARRND